MGHPLLLRKGQMTEVVSADVRTSVAYAEASVRDGGAMMMNDDGTTLFVYNSRSAVGDRRIGVEVMAHPLAGKCVDISAGRNTIVTGHIEP